MSRRSQYKLVATVTLTIALGALCAWWLVYAWADRSGPLPETVVFEIEPGTGFGDMASDLERLGVVQSAALFSTLARF